MHGSAIGPLRIAACLAVAGSALAPLEGACELVVINNGLAPPSAENVIDAADPFQDDFVIVRNVGCDDPDAVCATPGAATRVSLQAGGVVGEDLDVRDSSALRIQGGSVGFFLNGFEAAQIEMTGGSVGLDAVLRDASTLQLRDGLLGGRIFAMGSSRVTLRGGSVLGDLLGMQSSHIEIRGGAPAGALVAFDGASFRVVGEGFAVDGAPVPLGVLSAGTGLLTATLESGESIEIAFFHAGAADPLGNPATGTIAVAASAGQLMRVDFEGRVGAGFDTSNLLGLGEDLGGRTLRGSFEYLPSAAPDDGDPAPGVAIHESLGPDSTAWLSLPEVQIDSVPLPLPDFGLIPPATRLNDEDFAQIRLQADGGGDAATYLRFRAVGAEADFADYTVQLDLSGTASLLDGVELAGPVAVTDFGDVAQIHFVASLSTREGFEVLITELELSSLSVTPVPEPSASVGLLGGFGLLAALARRRVVGAR